MERKLIGLLREKCQNDDEVHDVERLPIMGTTTALRPGELWQLLAGSSTFRFAAQALLAPPIRRQERGIGQSEDRSRETMTVVRM